MKQQYNTIKNRIPMNDSEYGEEIEINLFDPMNILNCFDSYGTLIKKNGYPNINSDYFYFPGTKSNNGKKAIG
jgi:hypothetical protein